MRDIPTRVRQLHGGDSATVVRGVDMFRTFANEPVPVRHLDAPMQALHQAVTQRKAQVLYQGMPVQDYDDPQQHKARKPGG